jgi:hypothetical protein
MLRYRVASRDVQRQDDEMKTLRLSSGLISALFTLPAFGSVELQPVTIQAWDQYIRSVDARTQSRANGQRPFLWADETKDRRVRLQKGEVLVAPMVERGTQVVPEGLIHDWIGAAFLPRTSLERLIQFFGDYEGFRKYYRPSLVKSRLLSCSSDESDFAMTWQHSVLFVVAAIEARFRTHYSVLDAHRGYSVGAATDIFEIANYGRNNESLLPPGTGHGYIWRLHTVTRYEERDSGVYLEMEVTALTRPIPNSLHWLVVPMVSRLSINSMATMLRQTRDAVKQTANLSASACTLGRLTDATDGTRGLP